MKKPTFTRKSVTGYIVLALFSAAVIAVGRFAKRLGAEVEPLEARSPLEADEVAP